jgi:proton-translocating NADH-quinone oxidoreductase chain L
MLVTTYLLFATLLPFAGFVLLLFFGKRFRRFSGPLGTMLLLGSFALSVGALVTWVAKPEYNHAHYVEALTYRWIPLPATVAAAVPGADVGQDDALVPNALSRPALSIGLLVDSLTITMFLIVTFIAFLVHLFSITYLSRDARLPRYFAYLGLFCFSMLALILANSLLQIFVFWQLAGIAAYLLIGFWFERRAPAVASLKAAIVQRIGDAAFLIGLGILVMHAGPNGLTLFDAEGTSPLVEGVRNSLNMGSSEFLYLTSNAGAGGGGGVGFLGLHWLTWVGLCLFGGVVAKAAQFPLQVWFSEAMEAPAPASALVHATTMVAAGVYLIARIYPILTMDARLVIAVIGCVTLLMGALIALAQTDLKRVLAYLTLSQAGMMMLFLGAGGYVAGLLHLCTFAFFNACLFLAAGSVIHALGHEQRLEQMGGLWKKLPITAIAFLIGGWALIGAPGSSGAFSSQLGLAVVYDYARALVPSSAGHKHYVMLLFWVPALTMFLTAFVMGRCWWLTFAGQNRNEKLYDDAHESGLLTFPLILLAILCAGVWFEFFHMPDVLHKSLLLDRGLLGKALAIDASDDLLNHMTAHTGTYFFVAIPFAALLAIPVYFHGFRTATKIRKLPALNLLWLWLREKMYVDALYNGVVVTAVLFVARLAKFVDRYVLDAAVLLATLLVRAAGRVVVVVDHRVVDAVPSVMAKGCGRVFRWVRPVRVEAADAPVSPPT